MRQIKLICVLMFMGVYSFAQNQARTFESMGYLDQEIVGISGSTNFFVKIKPDDDVDNSRLLLQVRPSQVLNPNTSFIIISLKDAPVYTQRITGLGVDSVFTVSIPLNKKYLQPDGRFIKLRIAARMSVGDEYCKDIDNPACWITIKNNSAVLVNKKSTLTYSRSLRETIQEFTSIHAPVNADLDDVTAGGIIYTILRQQATSRDFEVQTGSYADLDSNSSRTVLVGSLNRLPANIRSAVPPIAKGQGLIYLVGASGYSSRQYLVVTGADQEGYRKAITVLANTKILNSAFSDKLLIDNSVQRVVNQAALPVVLSLEQLGGQPAIVEGVGALKQNFTFSLADYNAIPKKLTLHLETFFSNLKENDRGFLNVYLNDNLVHSTPLNDKVAFNGDIDLKPYLLTKTNGLTIEFRFHPGTNICKDGFANFFGFINPRTSTITFSGEKANQFYNFFNYPGEFRKAPLKFLLSPTLNAKSLSAVGELMYQINTATTPSTTLILPLMESSDKATMSDMKGYNVVALLNRTDPFIKNFDALPVQFTKDFQLYRDVQGSVSYSINDFSNSGIAQIFKQSGSTFLLISSLGDSVKTAFESVIKSFGTQFSSIESNVCIATSKGQSNFFFKLPEDSELISYRGEKNKLLIFWEQYKWFILGALLIFMGIAFAFVRKRVKKSQEIV